MKVPISGFDTVTVTVSTIPGGQDGGYRARIDGTTLEAIGRTPAGAVNSLARRFAREFKVKYMMKRRVSFGCYFLDYYVIRSESN